MKKVKLLILTLLSVLGMNTAWAETVSPYTVDFEKSITTSDHEFAVASNWGHIVDSYEDYWSGNTSYINYRSVEGKGVGESMALEVQSNQKSNNTYDLLVTPVVSGTVTIYAKPTAKYYNDVAFVEFYSLNSDGTARDQLLVKTNFSQKSNSEEWDYVALEVTLTTPQRIGIRGTYVYMDNFSATSAEIVPQTSLKVTAVMNAEGQTGTTGNNPVFNQGPDGNTTVSLKVSLENTGDIDLSASTTDNYTLTLAKGNSSSATTYFEDAPFDIPVDLAAGESAVFDVVFVVPVSTGYTYFYVRENVTGNTSRSSRYCNVLEYASKFIFDKAGTSYTNSSSATTNPIDFGKVNEATTLNYEIYNPGSAPLTINSISIDAPFTSDAPTEEFTVAAGEKKAINITFPAAEPGVFTGNIVIQYTNYGKETATYTLGVSGTVVDPSKNLITFDNGKTGDELNGQFPAGSIHYNQVYISSSDNKNYYLMTTSTVTKFITPLLIAEEGESFTYDTWYTGNSGSNAAVTVYVSEDRINWTQVDKQTYYTGINSSSSTFAVTLPEAGNYYLAFELTYPAVLDNIYGLTLAEQPEHNWVVAENSIPTTGKQNNEYTATISLHNINAEADVVETATLYVGGEAVVTVSNTDLPGNEKTAAEGTGSNNYSNMEAPVEITLSYKPHTFGTMPAYIELKSGDKVVTTDEVEVTIAEEKTESELAIGNVNTTNTSTNVPFYGTWADDSKGLSECDVLYTKAVLGLFNLKAGDVINAITFKGTPTGTKTFNNLTTEAWVGLEDENATFTAGEADKANMQHVKIHDAETVVFTYNETVDFTITLPEPIVWDGTSSIRISTNMNGNGTYLNIKFPVDNSLTNSADVQYFYSYYSHGGGSYNNAYYLPVAYLSLAVEEKTMSGTVIDDLSGQPIEGATITLYNAENDVKYSGTTDSYGNYNIKVVQDKLTYTVTVEADGYVTLNDGEKSFAEGNVVRNYALSLPTDLVLFSTDTEAPEEQYAATVTTDRILLQGLNTIVLPFETTKEELGAAYVLQYTGTTISADNTVTLNFAEVVTLEANVPYAVMVDEDASESLSFTNKEVTPSDNLTVTDDGNEFDFVGTYTDIAKGNDIVHKGDLVAGAEQFIKAKGGNRIAAYRAYMKKMNTSESNIAFNFNGEVITGIEAVELLDRMSGEYYNLNGQRVGTPQRGIYIKDGKKIIVK